MLRRNLFQAVFLVMTTAVVLMTQACLDEAASEECRTKPDFSAATRSSHWYYRVDRPSQRRCWFLSSGDSHVRHTSSLRHRELINRGTQHELEALNARTGTGPAPIQEPVLLTDEPMHAKLAAPQFAPEISETLAPHEVTTISFVRPHVEKKSLRRGSSVDLAVFCGALATALLIAGGVFQLIDRFNRSPKAASPNLVPSLEVTRVKKDALSSKVAKLNNLRERLGRSNISSPQLTEALSPNRQLH
jgi:hypothetical protein